MAAGHGGSRTRTLKQGLIQAGIDVQQAGYTGDLQHLLDPRIRDDEAQFGAVAQGGAVGPGEHAGAAGVTEASPGEICDDSHDSRSACGGQPVADTVSVGQIDLVRKRDDYRLVLGTGQWPQVEHEETTPEGLHAATREILRGRSQPG